jgi:FKBP-type peptidyl-prolyl cis-trans isomerase FkpA
MKKIREFGFYGILISLTILAFSCNKTNNDAILIDDEQRMLKQYFITHNINVQPLASGLYYLPTDSGSGIKPLESDLVQFNYTLRLVNDQVIGTNLDSVAKMNSLFKGGFFYRPLEYRLLWWFQGLQEGFQLMREGDKATFIIPSRLAYGKSGYASENIGSYYTLIYDLQLIKVIHDPVAYENTQIEKYIHDSIPASLPVNINDSGVYHFTEQAGTGNFPTDSTTVTLLYTLKLLDGTLVQQVTSSATPYTYVVGTDQVIPGFKQAVKEMKKGEEALIIIPYKQGYGETSSNLPPFSTLVYYIIILNIVASK